MAEELKKMNEAAIEDAFYRDLAFGTGGLRGTIGAGTNRMNTYVVAKASQGLANYLGKGASVVIGYDSRIKSDVFAKAAAGVFAANGIDVHIWPALLPVPTVSFAVRELKASAGVMITANPAEYSVWHYRVNYGLHFFFAFLTTAVVCFLAMRLIAGIIGTIQDKVESKKIRALEGELNEKLKATGSTAVYRCRYEDWKYVISYDESPFEEACKYMRKTIAEIERFIASGGDGGKITDVEDVYRLNIEMSAES